MRTLGECARHRNNPKACTLLTEVIAEPQERLGGLLKMQHMNLAARENPFLTAFSETLCNGKVISAQQRAH